MNRKQIAACVCAVFCLTACQAAPETDVVQNKNEGILESKIADTDRTEDAETAGDDTEDETGQTDAGTWTESFEGDTGITVTVDAEVSADNPDYNRVYRITPHEIEAEEIKEWVQHFFGDIVPCEPVSELSKTEIEEKIIQYRQWIQEAEENEEADVESLQSILNDYLDMYETAPETVEKKETDWTFHPWEYYQNMAGLASDSFSQDTMVLDLVCEKEGEEWEVIAYNRSEDDYMLHSVALYKSEAETEENQEEDQESAIGLVQDALTGLNLEDWSVYSCQTVRYEESIQYYVVNCQKQYDGIPAAVLPQLETIKGQDSYAALYYYETLQFYVCNGEIRSVWLDGMSDVSEIENGSVDVLSWEEIREVFRNAMKVSFTVDSLNETYDKSSASYNICIDTVEKALVRIKIADNTEEFRMVPAWLFYGSVGGGLEDVEEGGVRSPILVINAIDGTLIDTSLGY
ncbi:MAG: DUF6034 family protein [Lachnospiraceae bacterium]|nr:DUF6034 family protein [Lachnospiraceae bacterium]